MSELEDALLYQIKVAGLPAPERQKRLVTGRRFSCDFYWPDFRLIVEAEGGTWIKGAHTRGDHFESDCVKYNELALMGFTVLRFTTDMIASGDALTVIERALKGPQFNNVIISGNSTDERI